MYGGWINKYPKTFDVKNQEVKADDVNKLLFKETYRNLRTVNDIKELINLPKTSLKNGDICFVNDIKGDYALIDGVVYDIHKDNKGSYIRTYMRNNSTKVGNKLFASELTVSLYNDKTYRVKYICKRVLNLVCKGNCAYFVFIQEILCQLNLLLV